MTDDHRPRRHLPHDEKSMARKLLRRGQKAELIAAVFDVSFAQVAKIGREMKAEDQERRVYDYRSGMRM